MVQRLVQSGHPYVVLRGSVYCFRFALPRHVIRLCPDLPREIKRTLRTASYPEAIYLASQKTPLIQKVFLSRNPSTLRSICGQLGDFEQLYEEVALYSPRGVKRDFESSQAGQSITLTEAWVQFKSWKRWPDKSAKFYELLFDNLKFFLGDPPVDSITKADLKRTFDGIARFPKRNIKKYKGVPIEELSCMTVPEADRVSSKLVKEHLKLCQSLFSRYLVRELELLKVSPTDGLSVDYENHRYASLSDAVVREVLERSCKKPLWVRWFVHLAALSGARRSEIARLTSTDFRVCKDTQRHYFVINGGKTKAARRIVPVHSRLISLGMMEWVRQQGGDLFPTAKANPNRITDHFVSLVYEKTNDLGERIVFHSLRHTFITKARAAGVSTVLVQQVVGHEKSGAGITDRYTHAFPLKDIIKVVESVGY